MFPSKMDFFKKNTTDSGNEMLSLASPPPYASIVTVTFSELHLVAKEQILQDATKFLSPFELKG